MKSDSKPSVLKVVARSWPIGETAGPLWDKETILTENRVAGATVDFPIAGTCQPSKVCVRDCYAASNMMATPEAIAKQWRRQHSMDADPVAFAERIIREYDRRKLTYLRWNGVGDLTPAAVSALNHIIGTRPDITLWIVTRIPELAARVAHGPNAYLHFSLDKATLDRRDRFLAHGPQSANYFFSYQCEKDEVPPSGTQLQASVIFHRRYRPATGSDLTDPAVCPLNTLDDCTGACNACRRCFNGEAVRMRREAPPPSEIRSVPDGQPKAPLTLDDLFGF